MAESPFEMVNGDEASARQRPVLLHNQYLIYPDSPLGDLDSLSAKAYAAEDRRDLGSKLFALICTPGLPPRERCMSTLRGEKLPGLLPLVDRGAVDWPPLGQHCMAVIYERPLGGRLVSLIASGEIQVNEYDIQSRIIEPLTQALLSLDTHNIRHRSIRPKNLFFMDEEKEELVLGDFMTAPAGFDQPIVFETIERGMASPGGRGEGEAGEDLYALGVTLVFLIQGANPVSNLNDDGLFKSKIEQGSYATLCGKTRIPMALLEPLRGMLSDDPEARWDLQKLEHWIDGKRQSPIQKKPAIKSDIPFSFAGVEHNTPRTLARSFTLSQAEAAKTIKEGNLAMWLRRGIGDTDKADAVETTIEAAKSRQNSALASDEFIVAKISIILDPDGPIRYKGLSFMPDAYGPALAVELLRRSDVQVAAEIIAREIPAIWFACQSGGNESAQHEKTFHQLHGFLKINDPGFGIERCLYELNPSLPCQSPLVIQDYIVDIEDLLPALDKAANRVDTKLKPLDRHLVAFIASRFEEDIYPQLKALAASEEETSLIGMLSLLALMQWHLKTDSLYGLCSWVGGLLGPAINTYFNRTTRREIEQEIPSLVRQGSLTEIFNLIENAEKRKQDKEGYAAATAEFAAAEGEIKAVEEGQLSQAESAIQSGQQAAAMTSVIIAMIAISVLLINEIW